MYFIALFLIIVGALNWGYISYSGQCSDDLIGAVLPNPDHVRWVYAAVGLSGIVLLVLIAQRNVYNQRTALTKGLRAIRIKKYLK